MRTTYVHLSCGHFRKKVHLPGTIFFSPQPMVGKIMYCRVCKVRHLIEQVITNK